MKLPFAFTAAMLSARTSTNTSVCAPDSCAGLLLISRTCGHDVSSGNGQLSHYTLDCVCNSRGFADAVAA